MKVTNQQIKHLFDLRFPSYAAAVAGLPGAKDNAGKLRKYIERADAYLHTITVLFDENPREFAAQVRAAELKHMGPLHTIQQCAQVIADEALPDDGYEETKILRLKYRDLCEERLLFGIRNGFLPYLNTNTLQNFDTSRFSDAFFPLDGLVRASSLENWPKPKLSEIIPATVPPMGKATAAPDAPISDETREVISKYSNTPSEKQVPRTGLGEAIESTPLPALRARLKPGGGDSLTPMIWEICYDLMDTDEKVTPMRVLRELQVRAQLSDPKVKWPLMSEVSGGVKYEDLEGNERELNYRRLESRVAEWRRANNRPSTA